MNILVKTKIIFKTSYFLQDIVRRALICLYVVITYSLKFDNFFLYKEDWSASQSVKLKVEDQAAISGVNFWLCHDVADGISGGNARVSPEDLMEEKKNHSHMDCSS